VIEVILHPIRPRVGRFAAVVHGQEIVRSRQPFFAAARALLERGHDPATLLEARHEDDDIVALQGTVGEAARWSIRETDRDGPRRGLWQPAEKGAPSTRRGAENGRSGTGPGDQP